ncbi:uncharacterized protein [Panulirus ornatus]|uniref:uncharacterized protein n=1 Tax=Panulirus ornatus TaxID=150431 RepID=UPI003A87DD59
MLATCCYALLTYALLTPTWAHQACPRISVSRSALSPRGSSPLPLFSREPSPSSSSSSSPSSGVVSLPPATTRASSATSSMKTHMSSSFTLEVTKTSTSASSSSTNLTSSSTTTTTLNPSNAPNTNSSLHHFPTSLSPHTSVPFSSAASPSSSSGPAASPPSSGLCWTGGSGDSLALTPDHRGNLWLLTSSRLGPQVTPGRVWVLNFTSLTWHDLGQPQDDMRGGHEVKSGDSGKEIDSLSAGSAAGAGQRTTEPLVFCPWSQGLVALYSVNNSSSTWLRPYTSASWHILDQKFTFPSGAASVVASWCGRLRDTLWLLTATSYNTLETQATTVDGPPVNTGRQTLWKLDHTAKWSAIELVMDRENVFSWRHNLRSWSDERGDLFLLQRRENASDSLRVVKFDTVSGTRTILSLQPSRHGGGVWIPSASGELYSLFSDSQGSWIKTFSYYTGVVLSKERTQLPGHVDNLLVKINGTIYNTIPRCSQGPPPAAGVGGQAARPTVHLYHLALSSGCPRGNTRAATLQQSNTAAATTSHISTGPHTRRFSEIQTKVGEGRRAGADASPSPPHQAGRDNIPIFVTDGTDGGESELPPGPHQRNKNHTNNSIIFFSLSLSIFALVGIIAFVRRCVRCPPAHDLGNERETRGKPPSPLPVLYSIVSDDPMYETSVNNSPCPSHNALYDATVTTAADTPSATTPNGGTPNYMTPNSTTPTGLSPSTVLRHAVTPASFPKDPITYAITSTTSDVINIATNNAFAKYLTNSISDPTSIDTNNTYTTNSTSTTQF